MLSLDVFPEDLKSSLLDNELGTIRDLSQEFDSVPTNVESNRLSPEEYFNPRTNTTLLSYQSLTLVFPYPDQPKLSHYYSCRIASFVGL